MFPEFRTNNLILRRFKETDQPLVFEGLSDPDVIRYYGVQFDSLDATCEQMKWFATIEENQTGIWRAICSADGEQFYGACGLNNIHTQHKKAEIGYWLLPAYWGKGIINEAVPIICKYGFENLALHRIEAQVESENEASHRVLKKLNFTFEGTLRDCEIKHGRYISLDIYSILSNHALV